MSSFKTFPAIRDLRRFLLCLSATGCLLFFSGGCSILTRAPQAPSPPAAALIDQLRQKNESLTTYKGIGTVRRWQDNIRQTSRLAWMGAPPAEFLFILQNAFGQPVMQVSGDGKHLYYMSLLPEPAYHRFQSANPSLEPFVSIPIRLSEIIALLGGKIPLPSFDRAILSHIPSSDAMEAERILELQHRWPEWTQKIYLNDNDEVYKIERWNAKRCLVYRAELNRYERVDGYLLPFDMVLSTAEGDRFELMTDRCEVNFSVLPDTFVLTPDK